eukprot:NODE_196_length_15381_cov_0.267243.p3 type:complete len:343 gc:universal NODE_196_length_15381_cov_0.267243:1174-2202(+)
MASSQRGSYMASFGEKCVILFVIFLITFIPISSEIVVWIPWLEQHNRNKYIYLLPYNLTVLSIWINYFLSVYIAPGNPPDDWKPSEEIKELKKSQNKPRYCQVCRNYKPPRSHHCSACDVCICKMDHHCPWIGSCVGFKNQGFFIRFIVSASLGTFITLVLHCWRVYEWSRYPYNPWIHSDDGFRLIFFIIVNFLLSIFVFVPVSFLMANHIYYIMYNLTTIEDLEKNRSLVVEVDGVVKHLEKPYDVGKYNNISAVLGSSWYLWWFPTRIIGDGVYFPMRVSFVELKEKEDVEELQPHVRRGSEGYEIDADVLHRRLLNDCEEFSEDDEDLTLFELRKKLN